MTEPTHAPGWRGRPTSYVELRRNADQLSSLELYSLFVAVLLAGASLAAAAIVWAGPVARWIGSL